MTPEQIAALCGGIAAIVGALGVLVQQMSHLRRDVNGRMEDLLERTAIAARKEGELAGRDWAASTKRNRVRVAEPSSED